MPLLICLPLVIGVFIIQYIVPITVLVLVLISTGIFKAINRGKKNKAAGANIAESAPNERYTKVINYIVNCQSTGSMSDEVIYANLKNAGWSAEDIKKSFDFVLKNKIEELKKKIEYIQKNEWATDEKIIEDLVKQGYKKEDVQLAMNVKELSGRK